ncbi:MAG TPA: PepSY-associated TM helix domain-containing protein [Pedomonas sp.]|uniref:PepSY-associated TM helix domain-containing protein n=1 Tax=Pedomonas sp. TaxID=2976421 RepID=UPI002F3EC23D
MADSIAPDNTRNRNRRGFWLRHIQRWHWISSGLCLVGMLVFAFTGITLNHATQIEGTPQVTEQEAVLPTPLLQGLQTGADEGEAPLPAPLRDWLSEELDLWVGDRTAEWSEEEIYVSLPRPGGDAWLTVDRETGDVVYEQTDRGWIAYLNDLHKGRNTSTAWSWFIDIFAAACVIFSLTGLLLLQLYAGNRPSTWPVVGLGLVIPVILAILMIH